jgi:hypothetical protein
VEPQSSATAWEGSMVAEACAMKLLQTRAWATWHVAYALKRPRGLCRHFFVHAAERKPLNPLDHAG